MKLTIKKNDNEIVIEDLSIYFKELLELIELCFKQLNHQKHE